ncbi:MAG: AbrB/MazE/SpoVT family DNA-binding domain-containing protein [Leptolyngbyaceae cyanobacterium bins.302]|nr:AbrB/MazE/SpoVT family DNA-binding domain-containing protein [Leptolyngbyaceae cyanobacterium bins.302]
MEITQDGKIAIPADIQEQLGLLPGTEVELKVVGSILQLQKKQLGRGQALIDQMCGKATINLSTDEIMKLTRQLDD